MDNETIIAELEAQGYQVYPPRDAQAEWEMKVGMLLQSWHSIKNTLDTDADVVLTNRAYNTLYIIAREISGKLRSIEEEAA